MIRSRDIDIVIEEAIGPVRCTVRSRGGVVRAQFDLPKLPERIGDVADDAALACALSLRPEDIGFAATQRRCGALASASPLCRSPRVRPSRARGPT